MLDRKLGFEPGSATDWPYVIPNEASSLGLSIFTGKTRAGLDALLSPQTLMVYDSNGSFSLLLLVTITIQHLMEEKNVLRGLQYFGCVFYVLFSINHKRHYHVMHRKAHSRQSEVFIGERKWKKGEHLINKYILFMDTIQNIIILKYYTRNIYLQGIKRNHQMSKNGLCFNICIICLRWDFFKPVKLLNILIQTNARKFKTLNVEIQLSGYYSIFTQCSAVTMPYHDTSLLTRKVVPLVHSKQPVSSDCDHSRSRQTRLGVGCHVSDRGVGGELQDHDNILLGLVCEHQRTLQEEILLSGHDKTQIYKKEKTKKDKREGVGKEEEDHVNRSCK